MVYLQRTKAPMKKYLYHCVGSAIMIPVVPKWTSMNIKLTANGWPLQWSKLASIDLNFTNSGSCLLESVGSGNKQMKNK